MNPAEPAELLQLCARLTKLEELYMYLDKKVQTLDEAALELQKRLDAAQKTLNLLARHVSLLAGLPPSDSDDPPNPPEL